MNEIKYLSIPEFDRDLKHLLKKFKTLKDDLEVLKKSSINIFHSLNLDNNGIFRIQGYINEKYFVYKVKKFASKSLKGKGVKSGLRLIYLYLEEKKEIYFLEIYYKGIKENEDRNRIKEVLRRFRN